jgi:hypothetical protein
VFEIIECLMVGPLVFERGIISLHCAHALLYGSAIVSAVVLSVRAAAETPSTCCEPNELATASAALTIPILLPC